MTRPVLPWRLEAALPLLGVHAIRAKLDTGAWGTAMHATDVEVEGDRVRFLLHPWPERPGETTACEAALSDRRRVTSSNGQAELRPFIRTALSLGGLEPAEVEVSLTARPSMQFRLLVGRQALSAWDALVDPGGDDLAVRALGWPDERHQP